MNIIYILYLILQVSFLTGQPEANSGFRIPDVKLNDYLELNPACCYTDSSNEYQAAFQIVKTKDLKVRIDENSAIIDSLITLHNNVNWISSPGKLFINSNPSCEETITINPLENGQIKLDLELTNTTSTEQVAYVTMPNLDNINPDGNSNELYYLYPGQGTAISNINYNHETKYSSKFPHQFIDIFHKSYGGIFFMTEDSTNMEKDYWLKKTNSGINTGVTYNLLLQPRETIQLPSGYLGGHQGDWHEALDAYKTLLTNWFAPVVPRKQWFQEIFNFRQHFLHDNYGDETYDPATGEFSIYNEIQKDIEVFGGVDFVHLFDWSSEPNVGRVGKYDPGEYLGSAGWQNLFSEIELIQNNGIHVGLYFEGYLLSKGFDDGTKNWPEWQIITLSGNPSARWGEEYYVACPYVNDWQDYLAMCCRRATDWLNAYGVYLDELGFAWQHDYRCYDVNHGHKKNSFIPAAEAELLKKVRNELPADRVLYTEETPVDVNMQYQDGSFSYTINSQFNPFNDSRINLTRFINPDFKNFHIINVDEPMGAPIDKLQILFFNGEGVWIAGPTSSFSWFPQETRDLIKQTYRILHAYVDAFSSPNPVPLVPTLRPGLYANRFPAENRTIWTLFNNTGESLVHDELICIDHIEDAIYYDAWNQINLDPRLDNGKAYITTIIGENQVGCIVQETDKNKVQQMSETKINTSSFSIAPNPVYEELFIPDGNTSEDYLLWK